MVGTAVDAGIATITLQRPERLNALTWSIMDGIRAAIAELAGRDDVHALVITGSGDGFCAGYDLIDLDSDGGDLTESVQRGMASSLNPLCQAIVDASVPVVAAVNGPCAGGGLGLALLADIVVAAESSYFLVPQVSSLGIVPDAGATWILPRVLGRSRALGMLLTGCRVGAAQAEQWGLIWRCVPDEELMGEAYALAGQLARRRSPAVATRKLVDSAVGSTLGEQLHAEEREQSIALADPTVSERIRRFATRSHRGGRPDRSADVTRS
ncbi:enoyl-CoA hydratase/isomerase family protein [[Mycobacterium] crassicus]|uniref:Enoyl-CoA hydratase-related protein n=1 Tax=[Mycobacterium] crassicus TaxID=2872309 RepID=A0ABU5XEY4_9MYCO|nr:enoyl-CoA hydratase-related protein [Mycolicibacter sp. MYC098]MEB3020860.1 enoyl-CoA hydratase-related protein [Mycolicibacter sp. MYC098]